MAISVDQFTQQIADSGLISGDQLAAFVDGLPDGSKPRDAEQFARELVRQKQLTAYQAEEIASGRGQSLILGNYVILDKLGQGGMGVVLKAEHRRMERLVALKVISPKFVETPDALRRFQREVKAAARLNHPNIVIAYDADESGGTHFLVMEYVDGTDLSTLVKRHGPLPVEQALDCILQAARGLQYAHEHGVVHRDVKPANLLVDAQGAVKILDMGLARLDSVDGHSDELTGSGQIMETVDYMAPEQAKNSKHADQRADVYSLGVTLWYLLTGRPLYAGETHMEKLMAHQTEPIPSLRSARPEIPPALDAIFGRMVAKTPEARCQAMAKLIADLERLRSGAEAAMASHAGAADLEATLEMSAPQVATDPQTEQSPASANRSMALRAVRCAVPAPAARLGRAMQRDWWQDWRKRTAAGLVGLLVILLGIWIVVRDKEGNEVARVRLPAGGSVTQESDGSAPSSVTRAAKQKPLPPWNLPPGSPAPAIAPFDAAKAKEYQAAWAKHLGVAVEMQNSIGMKFALIPPGEFDMGSTEEEVAKMVEEAKAKSLSDEYIERLPPEAPKHRVRITKPFWLGCHEVTRGQFRRFMEDSGYQTEAERDGKGGFGLVDGQWEQDPRFVWNADFGFDQADDHPVVNVSWNDATAFCAWLSKEEGEKSQLPTEAQWEYACRAGTTTRWYSGDDETALRKHASFNANSGGTSHPVSQLQPNAWGAYDMHGNAREWCHDRWGENYYVSSLLEDPTGPAAGSIRVIRGSSWNNDASRCRAANRDWGGPWYRYYNLGFRLARAVSSPSLLR